MDQVLDCRNICHMSPDLAYTTDEEVEVEVEDMLQEHQLDQELVDDRDTDEELNKRMMEDEELGLVFGSKSEEDL